MSKIQLYSLATPNGQKVGIALEEMGLEYEPHTINIMKGDQFQEPFVTINPNSKIPAIVDPDFHGESISIIESGAILLHLADKSGKFLSKDPKSRSETIQWLFFQMGGVGPMFGQFGHFFKFAKDKCDHPYPLDRYKTETKRLLSVIEKRLDGRTFMVGDEYSIADMAIFPWTLCLDKFYEANEILELKAYENIQSWIARIMQRPATQRGLEVCKM
ncbi:MAG: glutathione S-transferase [Leptospira sp.]|nr:MAG: glutathione S-transferase [Leptospira sp.]